MLEYSFLDINIFMRGSRDGLAVQSACYSNTGARVRILTPHDMGVYSSL